MRNHPLHEAIALLRKAKKAKAHPKIIKRLEGRIEEEAAGVRNRMSRSEFGQKFLHCLENGMKFEMRGIN